MAKLAADLGPGYVGLVGVVGYKLNGGDLVTAGVVDRGGGKYVATAALDPSTDYDVCWYVDGGTTPVAIEAINATVLGSTGLDAIPVTAPTGPAATYRGMLVQLWRNTFGPSKFVRSSVTAGTYKTLADDGTTVITTQAVADDGVTQTVGGAT